MKTHQLYNIAPCLKNGPLSAVGINFINEINKIPKTRSGDILKTLITYYVSIAKEVAFKKPFDPTSEIVESLKKQIKFINSYNKLKLNFFDLGSVKDKFNNFNEGAFEENSTANYYGKLFKDFNPEKYFNEATEMLETRLLRNEVFPEGISEKSVLDAGCGGGKYSVAWKKLAANKVTGIDFSNEAIFGAKERLKFVDLDVVYEVQDIQNLTFQNETFDIVYCFGVLHHLPDPKKAISELYRVLKKNGLGWFYVIEDPGGYNWDIIEILRIVMRDVDRAIAINTLKLLGLPPNKVFRTLDHVMVPVNKRFSQEEFYKLLQNVGAKDIRHLKRGMDFDRLEKVYQKEPFAELKYGIGQQFVVFRKA